MTMPDELTARHRDGKAAGYLQTAPSLGDALSMPIQDLSRLSLDFLNLLCASDLPDTADLDIDGYLKKLAAWTQHVHHETDRNLPRLTGIRPSITILRHTTGCS